MNCSLHFDDPILMTRDIFQMYVMHLVDEREKARVLAARHKKRRELIHDQLRPLCLMKVLEEGAPVYLEGFKAKLTFTIQNELIVTEDDAIDLDKVAGKAMRKRYLVETKKYKLISEKAVHAFIASRGNNAKEKAAIKVLRKIIKKARKQTPRFLQGPANIEAAEEAKKLAA